MLALDARRRGPIVSDGQKGNGMTIPPSSDHVEETGLGTLLVENEPVVCDLLRCGLAVCAGCMQLALALGF